MVEVGCKRLGVGVGLGFGWGLGLEVGVGGWGWGRGWCWLFFRRKIDFKRSFFQKPYLLEGKYIF